MSRDLSQKDIDLLKQVAPECKGLDCAGSGAPYRSILPPLANHFATDESDFRKRLEKLGTEDLQYLLSLTQNGSESLNCVPPQYLQVFIDLVNERLKLSLTKESFYNFMKEC